MQKKTRIKLVGAFLTAAFAFSSLGFAVPVQASSQAEANAARAYGLYLSSIKSKKKSTVKVSKKKIAKKAAKKITKKKVTKKPALKKASKKK